MQKQVPMTISYFMPLVTKIYIFLGDDEVVQSIDPAKVCPLPLDNHKITPNASDANVKNVGKEFMWICLTLYGETCL